MPIRIAGMIFIFSVFTVLAETPAVPTGVTVSGATTFQVKMSTILVIPAGRKVEQIRVYHAIPEVRPWSNVRTKFGASELKFNGKATQQFREEDNSHHLYWEINGEQQPGAKHEFTSNFSVRSAFREFRPEKVRVAWKDYEKPAKDPKAVVSAEESKKVSPQIADLATAYKKHAPPMAVKEFSKWIKNTIKYDASVPYIFTDTNSILKEKRGHCGHQAHLMQQFCTASGIPNRIVKGLNLYAMDGNGELGRIRADFVNIHTWMEVYFPNVGWVELEPALGDACYQIPARNIQNNDWFQNYALWLKENGIQKVHEWKPGTAGSYFSDYRLEHRITYSIRK